MALLLLRYHRKKIHKALIQPKDKNKEVVKYDKSKIYFDWSDNNLRTYKDKEKIEDKQISMSTFANEKNRYLDFT